MSTKSKFPRVQDNALKYFVLFDQQSKIPKYSVYNNINQGKSSHLKSWKQRIFDFCLKNHHHD